jgi:predicted dehydrogenase
VRRRTRQPRQHEDGAQSCLFQDDAYISIDLQQKVLNIVRKPPAGSDLPLGQVLIEERTYEQGDALRFEVEAFLRAILEGTPPVVTGEDGLRALEDRDQDHGLVQREATR